MNQRESRYVTVAKIAYRLTKRALPKYSHAKSPHHFELPQLAACVLMMFYLHVSYRDTEEWLLATDKVCQALELPRIPDHTTLQRTYRKLRKLDFEKIKNRILEEENIQESVIASDSTGFSLVKPVCITKLAVEAGTNTGSKARMQLEPKVNTFSPGNLAICRAMTCLI